MFHSKTEKGYGRECVCVYCIWTNQCYANGYFLNIQHRTEVWYRSSKLKCPLFLRWFILLLTNTYLVCGDKRFWCGEIYLYTYELYMKINGNFCNQMFLVHFILSFKNLLRCTVNTSAGLLFYESETSGKAPSKSAKRLSCEHNRTSDNHQNIWNDCGSCTRLTVRKIKHKCFPFLKVLIDFVPVWTALTLSSTCSLSTVTGEEIWE